MPARSTTLVRALNDAAIAMLDASDVDGMLDAMSSTLASLGQSSTIYRVDRAAGTLTLAHYHVDSRWLPEIERVSGLSPSTLQLPLGSVQMLTDAAGGAVCTAPTFEVMEQVLRAVSKLPSRAVAGAASAIIRLLGIQQLAALPITGHEGVEFVVVVLSRELSDDDLLGLELFAKQISFAVRMVQSHQHAAEATARLQRVQHLEAVGHLASGIAHDLNNMLTPIAITTESLLADPGNDRIQAPLLQIQAAERRATESLRRLLGFARPLKARPEPLSVRPILLEAGKLAGGDIVVALPDRPLPVRADPTKLLHVLVNLLLNARQCGAQTVELRCEGRDGLAEITVSDDGPGMSAQELGRAFEPFYTTREDGTGLGLSVSRDTILDLDGTLHIDSEPGTGTCATIRLPLATLPAGARSAPPSVPPALAPLDVLRVLLVEDDDHVATSLKLLLEMNGYQAVRVASLAEAITRLGEVDVVLSDVQLTDGLAWPLADHNVPIVFMSGRLAEPPQGAGMLQKPFSATALVDALTVAMELSSSNRAGVDP